MAKSTFLLQGVKQNNDHETAIKSMFDLEAVRQIILSVAFVRESGVRVIADQLKQHAKHTVVYAGIRNSITSAQGLWALLNTGVKLFGVDTASTSTIFHPKVYLAFNQTSAYAIVGSANLTFSGLNENIEASVELSLNRQDETDEAFLNDVVSSMTALRENYPEHVFQVVRESDVARLLRQGRIEDENFPSPSRATPSKKDESRDQLRKIKLFKKQRPLQKTTAGPSLPTRVRIPIDSWVLMWVSKGLTERDLNIPKGNNTNPTGSMLLKKGQMEGMEGMEEVDHRSYFRNTVFDNLSWSPDPKSASRHLERAEGNFEIVVKGIGYGVHCLKLTHNSRTDTRSYQQFK